jgi:FHA domain/von Willebrand factor type A domain
MAMIYKNVLFLLFLVGLLMDAAPVIAGQKGQINVLCKVLATNKKTECGLRTLSGNNIRKVTARVLGRDKDVGPLVQLPDDPKTDSRKVAILFVVDTSKSMTVAGFSSVKKQMQAWLGQTRPRHVVGIARFDKDLEVLAKIGSSKTALDQAVSNLKRDGNNTEFYKSVERGIENLANFSESSRRFLVLISDGASEDAAWNEGDVVTKAKQSEVAIFAIGYRGGTGSAINKKASLQHLEKLALETGGVYAEADNKNQLGNPFSDDFFSLTDNGGWIEIDTSDERGRYNLELVVTDSEDVMRTLDRELLFSGKVPFVRQMTEDWNTGGMTRGWLVAKALGLLALILASIFLLIWWLSRSSSQDDETTREVLEEEEDTATIIADTTEEDVSPSIVYAFIDLLEGDGPPRREEINTTAFRIGRAPTNDLVLEHPTISNDHAVITITADNAFEIRDVHSSNGTFVNGEKIGRAMVQNGDHITVGVVNMKLVTQV